MRILKQGSLHLQTTNLQPTKAEVAAIKNYL